MTGPDSPPIEGARPGDESVVGAYFGRLTELLDSSTNARDIARGFARQMGGRRFMSSELQARLSALAKERQALWSQLHQQTIAMTTAVARELAIRTVERHKQAAIEHQAGAGRLDAGRSA